MQFVRSVANQYLMASITETFNTISERKYGSVIGIGRYVHILNYQFKTIE